MDTSPASIPGHTDSRVGPESNGRFPVAGFDPDKIVETLNRFDPAGLDADELLRLIGEMERFVAALRAAQLTMMAEYTRTHPATPEPPVRGVRHRRDRR